MIEDRGDAPQAAALPQRLEPLEHGRDGHAEPLGGRGVGLGDDRHRPLRRAHGLDVLVAQLDRVELHRLDRLAGGAQRVRPALHLEVHADLEELDRRQLADRLRAGLRSAITSSVPSSPSRESGSTAIVNQRLKSWSRR